jgi:hypothetical protein
MVDVEHVQGDGTRHGSRSTYQRGGCRCGECTYANTAYQRQWRAGHPGYAFGQAWRSRRQDQDPPPSAE